MGGLFGGGKKKDSTPAPVPTAADTTADEIETASGATYRKIADANAATAREMAPVQPTGAVGNLATATTLETVLPSKRVNKRERQPGTLATGQAFGYG